MYPGDTGHRQVPGPDLPSEAPGVDPTNPAEGRSRNRLSGCFTGQMLLNPAPRAPDVLLAGAGVGPADPNP